MKVKDLIEKLSNCDLEKDVEFYFETLPHNKHFYDDWVSFNEIIENDTFVVVDLTDYNYIE